MLTKLPLQPFNDRLRDRIGKAIIFQMEEDFQKHGTDYDPDGCWMAADRVIAVLAEELLGIEVTVHHGSIIGMAELHINTDKGPRE